MDLETYQWTVPLFASEEVWPEPRNSHSAVLLPLGPDDKPALLIVGGANGDRSNGSPPRGGVDSRTAFWLTGLEDAQFRWVEASDWTSFAAGPRAGRGHVAARLPGTSTVVCVSGGHPTERGCLAFRGGMPQAVAPEAGAAGPCSRAL